MPRGAPLSADERVARAHELGIIVDIQDEWLLSSYTWRLVKGYPRTEVWDGVRQWPIYIHHCIMGVAREDGILVDHRNRNPLDNRRDNLRYADYSINRVNSDDNDAAALISPNRVGNFRVKLIRQGVTTYLGTYHSLAEAEHVRDTYLASQASDSVRRRSKDV